MAVVVDKPSFDALGNMDHVRNVSNPDIVSIIVRFDEDTANLAALIAIDGVRFTTLERAVEGLTAGTPTTKAEFERKIAAKLRND